MCASPLKKGPGPAWLYDLLKPHVSEVVVCNPRKNALLKDGSESDRIDARKLAELLRGNHLKPVYHGEQGLRTLKELARSYLTISKDVTRVMNRLKALYRSWGIACAGTQVYAPRHRSEWLGGISEAGVRRRAEHCYFGTLHKPEQVTDEANPSESVNIGRPCDQLVQTSHLTSQSAHLNSDRPFPQSTLEPFSQKLDQI